MPRMIARVAAAGLFIVTAVGAATTALAAPLKVKVAFIDPLSGGGASSGDGGLRTLRFLAERNNATNPDVTLEITAYDNKLNPQESIVQAQKAIDAGANVIVQGIGSSVSAALIDFINKHNDRNPGKEAILLNHSGIDPILNNAKCSYWHFRFDASSDIKMAALTSHIANRPEIKKVYLLNQDYSFGHAVRSAARAMLKQKRPDIEIVGDEVTPLQKVNDFSPYIAKIKASGADTVITGNWSQDLALLVKAAGDAALQVNLYTYSGGSSGIPTAIKQANLSDRVLQVVEGYANVGTPPVQELERAFRAKAGQDLVYPRMINLVNALTKAVTTTKSADPKQIARALEGMRIQTIYGKEGYIRADDHQFFQPMYIAAFGPVDAGKVFDSENTGWGWTGLAEIPLADTLLPTTCRMDRPS